MTALYRCRLDCRGSREHDDTSRPLTSLESRLSIESTRGTIWVSFTSYPDIATLIIQSLCSVGERQYPLWRNVGCKKWRDLIFTEVSRPVAHMTPTQLTQQSLVTQAREIQIVEIPPHLRQRRSC